MKLGLRRAPGARSCAVVSRARAYAPRPPVSVNAKTVKGVSKRYTYYVQSTDSQYCMRNAR